MRLFRWLFVMLLTAVPIVISLYADAQAQTAVTIGDSSLWQRLIPAVFMAILMGISTAATLFVPPYLREWPLELKVVFTAVLTFFTILITWLAIMLAYASVSFITDITPTWVFRAGWLSTILIIIGILYWTDQLYQLLVNHNQ